MASTSYIHLIIALVVVASSVASDPRDAGSCADADVANASTNVGLGIGDEVSFFQKVLLSHSSHGIDKHSGASMTSTKRTKCNTFRCLESKFEALGKSDSSGRVGKTYFWPDNKIGLSDLKSVSRSEKGDFHQRVELTWQVEAYQQHAVATIAELVSKPILCEEWYSTTYKFDSNEYVGDHHYKYHCRRRSGESVCSCRCLFQVTAKGGEFGWRPSDHDVLTEDDACFVQDGASFPAETIQLLNAAEETAVQVAQEEKLRIREEAENRIFDRVRKNAEALKREEEKRVQASKERAVAKGGAWRDRIRGAGKEPDARHDGHPWEKDVQNQERMHSVHGFEMPRDDAKEYADKKEEEAKEAAAKREAEAAAAEEQVAAEAAAVQAQQRRDEAAEAEERRQAEQNYWSSSVPGARVN